MCYHGSVVPIKIYPLHHDESFHSSLPLFLFDWLLKRWEITKVVLINCNCFQLLCHTSGQMHVNMIISESAVKIIKHNVNVTVKWLKSQATSHGDFMYAFLGCYLAIQPLKCYIIFTMYWFKSRTTRFTTFYVWTNWFTCF